MRGRLLNSVRIPFITLLSAALVQPAFAQPTGATVVAGSAQVAATSGTLTTVTQSSAKAIINWQDFSVAAGSAVQFNQPNSSAITLNRVTGGNASSVQGAISANGQVWLLNPNGVLFGNGARINVGGLLATTSDIADQDFLGGNYSFSTGGNGAVVNNGAIRAAKGGSVVLSAPSVANNGVIVAKAGHVVLGGTDTFTVDFNGDHLLSYAAGPASHSGNVSNTGTINAPGGQVLLTARAAAGVADGVVNNSGMVEATSAREENGEIILDAGDGTATNSGTLNASGKGAGETGGSVQVLGQTVAVSDGAKIDVSGDAGGGQVLIGGNFHGAGPQPDAQTTTVGKAIIKADAVTKGNGGKVAVWSNGTTQFGGAISAKGGAQGGNGGQVETSGAYLGVSGDASVVTAAAHGIAGNWLLDPTYIEIKSGGQSYSAGIGFTVCCTGPTPIQIDPASIVTALGSGNVQLQANTDLTVTDAITVANGTGTGNSLVFQAGRSVIVNAPITFNSGKVVLSAADPGAVSSDTAAGAAFITSGSSSDIVSAATIVLNLENGGTLGSSIGASSSAPFMVGSNGTLSLAVTTTGANAYVQSSSAVLLDNNSTALLNGAGQQTVTVGNGVNLSNTGNFNLTAAGAIAQTQVITSNDLNVTATGGASTITLNSSNTIYGSARFIAPSDVQYTNDQTNSLFASVLGASNVGGNLTVSAGSRYLELSDPSGALQATNITLNNTNTGTIDNRVTQAVPNALPIVTGNLTVNMATSAGAIILGNNANNVVTGMVTLNGGSLAGDSFSNTVSTTLAAPSGPVDDLQVTISDPSGQTSPTLTIAGTIRATGSFGINLNAVGGIQQSSNNYSLIAPSISLISFGGAIGDSSQAIQIGNSGSIVSLTASNLGAGGDVYLSSNSPVSIDGGAALSGGNLSLRTSGATSDITVASAVATSNNAITLFAGGSLKLNASVTDTGGPIFALANNGCMTACTGSILDPSGTAVLTASQVALQLGGDARDTGTIGANAANSITLNGASPINLEVQTPGRNVFINSQVGINISHVDGTLGITGLDLSDGQGAVGSLTLSAAGSMGATNGNDVIVTQDATLATTAGGSILLNGGNGNFVTGALRLTAAGNVNFLNNGDTTLGATSVGGSLTLEAGGLLALADVNGGTVNVTGSATLTADAGDVTQLVPNAIPLVTGQGLTATGANVFLDGLDVNSAALINQISGTANFTIGGGGALSLHNSAPTSLGSVGDSDHLPISSIDVEVGDFGLGTSGFGLNIGGTVSAATVINAHADGGIQSAGGVLDAPQISLDGGYGSIGDVADALPLLIKNSSSNSPISFSASTNTGDLYVQSIGLPGPSQSDGSLDLGSVGSQSGRIALVSAASIVQIDGLLSGPSISLEADGGSIGNANGAISLDSLGATIALSLNTSGGDAFISSAQPVSIDDNGILASPGVHLGSGSLSLSATGAISQTAAIVASNLTATAQCVACGNSFDLTWNNAANAVAGMVTLTASGNIALTNSVATTLGQNSAGGTLTVNSTGDLTLLNSDTQHSGATSGAGIVLATAGNFLNQAGSTALVFDNGPGAAFQIYSAAPNADVFGDANGGYLQSGNQAVWNTSYPAAVSQGGNRYVFAAQPTVNVTLTDVNKTYGADATAALQQETPVYSGFQAADPNGAYLADNAANIVSGTPTFASTGAAAGANVSATPYAITITGLSLADGYSLGTVSGGVIVNPATLTYAANTASRAYGAANPAFSGTVTGFVNGETQASATTGTLSFATLATTSSNAGSYSINGLGLSAANYVFAQASGNATALTINPATLTYAANTASRAYGAANPAFSGTVTGFVNGDTQSSATTGTLSFGSTAASGVGSYAINGSGLTANGNYSLVQASSNATALTINPATLTYAANTASRAYGAANPAFSGTVTGFVNGDTQTSATTGTLSFATPATASSNVGSYSISGLGLSAANYVFAQAVGNATALTINPATLTYAANTASRAYGAANPAFTGTVTGFVNGDTQTNATTGTLSFGSTATVASSIGSYAVNGSGLTANGGNYVFAQAGANSVALIINPATLTYTADLRTAPYGATLTALRGTVTGFVNGDTQSSATTGTLAFTSAYVPGAGVNTYAVNGSGLSASNYVFVQAAGNATALTITPEALTENLTGTVSKTFDGTTAATLTSANYAALTGVFGSDQVSLASFPTSGTYDTAAVGSGKTVIVTGLGLTGANAANYTIANTAMGAVGVILPASGSSTTTTSSSAPTVTGFVVSTQNPDQLPPLTPPPTFPPSTGNNTLPGTPPPPPPPGPPPGPLADLSSPDGSPPSDTTTSDQTTEFLSDSLNGGGSGSNSSTVIIPGLLNANTAPPVTVSDSGSLSSWGNDSLWQ